MREVIPPSGQVTYKRVKEKERERKKEKGGGRGVRVVTVSPGVAQFVT